MHLLSIFGSTYLEIEKAGLKHLFLFMNQHLGESQDQVLSKTLNGLSDYVKEMCPDLIVVHGDRVEALAGTLVGALNDIFVAHIEGGEVSGTIDESIRHAITKVSHFHFVANDATKQRLLQLGEDPTTIYVIGSPDLDAMHSSNLPTAEEAFSYYEIPFDRYAVSILHPVTTELNLLKDNVETYIRALLESNRNYVVVYPNNGPGFSIIIYSYQQLTKSSHFKVFPSLRFEYFLTLMRSAQFIIGNSSSGIREAPFYAVPSINVGARQTERSQSQQIMHSDFQVSNILTAISRTETMSLKPFQEFGQGDSSKQFLRLLLSKDLWNRNIQKRFVSNFS